MNTILNVVIGNPLVEPWQLFASSQKDWEQNEKNFTLFTDERRLATILKDAGIVSSISEIRRNKPELNITLDKVDFIQVRWGKKILHIAVGE